LTEAHEEPTVTKSSDYDVNLQALIAENKALKEELTAKRAEQQQTYVPKPLDLSEYKTRKIYIDSMPKRHGKNWICY
jgi:type I restriction enzyme R subunit